MKYSITRIVQLTGPLALWLVTPIRRANTSTTFKDHQPPTDSIGLKVAAFEPTRFALLLLVMGNEKPPAVSRRGF
jgi:hypothetical protein